MDMSVIIGHMEEYFTPKELAQLLKVHHRTIRRLINDGKLNAVDVGTEKKPLWRIMSGSWELFLRENWEKERGKGEEER